MHNWKEIFSYSRGKLYWAVKHRNRTKIGDLVGSPNGSGYLKFQYLQENFLVHRVIWEMHNGPIPEGMQVDHIWHDKLDNRIENLRLVTVLDNHRNRAKSPKNTSGVTGVCWNKRDSNWLASITIKGKRKHLGTFDDLNEAAKARKDAEILYNFHPNHGK